MAEGRIHVPHSRIRSLLRDLAETLDWQMRYWGIDARGGDRSLIVAVGLSRMQREFVTGEGSSRYREKWRGGWIEIHSFCAGYYHSFLPGVLFSRGNNRIHLAAAGDIPEPLYHRHHSAPSTPDSIFPALPPFLSWLLDYEHRVEALARNGYRDECWRRLGGRQLGLHPKELKEWWHCLLHDPPSTPRLHPQKKKPTPTSRINTVRNPAGTRQTRSSL